MPKLFEAKRLVNELQNRIEDIFDAGSIISDADKSHVVDLLHSIELELEEQQAEGLDDVAHSLHAGQMGGHEEKVLIDPEHNRYLDDEDLVQCIKNEDGYTDDQWNNLPREERTRLQLDWVAPMPHFNRMYRCSCGQEFSTEDLRKNHIGGRHFPAN